MESIPHISVSHHYGSQISAGGVNAQGTPAAHDSVQLDASASPNPLDLGKVARVFFNRETVHIQWNFKGDDSFSTPPAVSPDGKNIFASDGKTLYGLDRKGKLRWQKKLDSWTCSKPICGSDGSVYM